MTAMPDAREVNEMLLSLALLRRYPAALQYAEDFGRVWRATVNDPEGRAALTLTYRQAQADGEARGGVRCCGTTGEVHNPWCRTGPRRRRAEDREEWDADRDEKDMDPHYYDGADDA
jgi:hypothetical protein